MGPAMWIAMGIFWVVLIVFAVYAIRLIVGSLDSYASRRSRGEQILEERFARGEITAKEYRQRRSALEGR
jgi:uncharacterized membrane protein